MLLLFAVQIPSAHADEASSEARDRLEAFTSSTETYRAEFEQTLYDEDSEPLESSSGSVILKRPGRFVWRYDGPEAQVIVADGEKLWLYDQSLEQVTVNPLGERLAGTPLELLMGDEPLEDTFDIKTLGESEGVEWLELTPTTGQSDFDAVFVGLDEQGLAAMELRDGFGQATQIRFSDFRADPNVKPEVFEFDIPEGVDVIGLDKP